MTTTGATRAGEEEEEEGDVTWILALWQNEQKWTTTHPWNYENKKKNNIPFSDRLEKCNVVSMLLLR